METTEISLEFIAGTEADFLLSDGDNEQWIPVSQIDNAEYFTHYDRGKVYEFEISDSMLEEKEFI